MDNIINSLQHLFSDNFPYLIELIAFGFVFTLLELKVRKAEKNTGIFKNDMRVEILNAIINMFVFIPLVSILSLLLIDITLRPLFQEQLFAQQIQSLPLAIQIVLGAVILDFATYWRHRFTHIYMWPYHSMHHSVTQITWITGFRLHPIDLLTAIIFSSVILYVFGFDGTGFVGAMIIVKIMNYFTHMNYDLKFSKPLRYIIASPHYHRWHHATKKEAYNTNYCGAFPFMDLLFGSYYHPEELPPKYGLSPMEQKAFPEQSYIGWMLYPFKRNLKSLAKKLL